MDKAKDVAQHFKISAMPTFIMLKGRNAVETMRGADPAGLEALVRKHAPATAASGSGSAPVEKGLEGFVSNSKELPRRNGLTWVLAAVLSQRLDRSAASLLLERGRCTHRP